jgi:type I restriction-modification system DNA methylase subunit
MSDLPQQLTLVLEKHHNHYLFSDYYLDHLLPRRLDWQEATSEARAAMKRLQAIYAAFTPTENEAQTERDWIRLVLETLNHVFEVQPSIATPDGVRRPDYVFFATDKARKAAKPLQGQEDYPATALAVGDAKHWDRSLDQTLKNDGGKPRDPFTNKNPSWQIYFYMLHTGLAWGILTNGRAWRLCHKDTAHKLNYYYEVDLPALLGNGDVEAFKYFYLFFRQASFITNGEGRTWLDLILQESRDYAEGVGEDLKEQVYEALRHVAQGFLDYPGNDLATDHDTLKAIYDNSLILLYRLLFILFAESRGLLPLQDNETYRLSYSLDAIKKEIERTLSKPILPTSRLYWPRLEELFGAINKGNEHLGVPAYNGDLFAPQKHPFLEQYVVGDQELRRAIDNLARTDTEEGRVFVDYRDLEVRHLGSIYEGLLEYQLRYAEEDLAVVKEKGRERYVPAGEGHEVAVPAGRVYLVTDRGERKATGSYYTPDYIVKYIVAQTLQPLLDETVVHWANRKNVTEEDLVNDILSLDVLDPAMGSGHFLVEATEYIARYLVGLGLEATAGMGSEAELDYWKRRVVQACIYGVDLNPLAVELAKLSLWLATVSKDKPLSFLDHHLRCGNSLIGARVADLGVAPVVKKPRKAEEEPVEQLSLFDDSAFVGQMRTATRFMQDIEAMASDTVEGVKEQERAYQSVVRDVTRQYRQLADLWTARYFGVEYDAAMWLGLVSYATGHAPAQVSQYEAILKQAGTIAEDRHFFHWELEFPEVFFDRFGGPLKDRAGFDAVVGNPPWIAVDNLPDEDKVFCRVMFAVAQKFDVAHAFVQQGIALSRDNGFISMVIPEHSWIGEFHTTFRRNLLDSAQLLWVASMKEGDFSDVANPASMFGGQVTASGFGEHEFTILRTRSSQDLEREAGYRMPISLLDEDVVLNTENEPVQLYRIFFDPRLVMIRALFHRICWEYLDCFVVVSDGIKTADALHEIMIQGDLRPEQRGKYVKALRSGVKIPNRYGMPQWDHWWVLREECATEYKSRSGFSYDTPRRMYCFNAPRRLIMRQTEPTIIATLDDVGYRFPNSIFTMALKADVEIDLLCLLAILNSTLIREYYLLSSQVGGTTKPQLYINQLKSLPIHRIIFTTPQEERGRLGEIGITEATEWIASTEGLSVNSVPFGAFSGSNLGHWLDARLTAEPEQSDVVHDLLAHLAEQMIAMNKEKQAETRGFLNWLAGYTGLPVEDWTLKTSLKAYYEHDWEEMRGVLDRNSSKITKVNVKGREASDLIRDEWEVSVGKLLPLLTRIAATDRLIDLIVYRLYGLTEEEVAVVEGKS